MDFETEYRRKMFVFIGEFERIKIHPAEKKETPDVNRYKGGQMCNIFSMYD